MGSANLVISGRSELRSDEVALIGKKKYGRAVMCKVNAGASSQSGHGVGLPELATGRGVEADELSSRTRAVNIIVFQKWSGGITQNAAGARGSVWPENFCRRLGLIELKHQAADEESIPLDDRS